IFRDQNRERFSFSDFVDGYMLLDKASSRFGFDHSFCKLSILLKQQRNKRETHVSNLEERKNQSFSLEEPHYNHLELEFIKKMFQSFAQVSLLHFISISIHFVQLVDCILITVRGNFAQSWVHSGFQANYLV